MTGGTPISCGVPERAGIEAVAALVASGVPRKRAAEIVAGLTGMPRNTLYRADLWRL